MKSYYRVMLGKGSEHANLCLKEGFIGADFGIKRDLSGPLPDDFRAFNKEFIPIYLADHPEKNKISAGLACGALHTIAWSIEAGDIILSPDGEGNYLVGEATNDYKYVPGQILPHRRPVKWFASKIKRLDMSQALKNSSGSIGTVSDISKYGEEIERLISGIAPPTILTTDQTIEDPSVFALEKHLEDFLVKNWVHTELGKNYDIYEEDGELVGQQYPSDTGPLDILAISKDKKELLVVELKKGRASDYVVGQTQRYMGFVAEELAEDNQTVKGCIIALEDDLNIKRALSVAKNIEFYRYQISFKLSKVV